MYDNCPEKRASVGEARTYNALKNGSFSAAASFIMLHHVPSVALQDRLLAEIARVLKPRGVLFGADSLNSPDFRTFYLDDVCAHRSPPLPCASPPGGFHGH